MPTRIDDRYLWLGFGVFFFFAAKGIRHAITNTVRLTELDPISTRSDEDESRQPEDRIAISTLKTLALSPNPSIASSAASLIVTRFASLPDAAEIISTDLYSKDEDTRRRAKQAIAYLQDWDTTLSTSLDETRTFAAREALVEAARTLRSPHPSTPHLPTLAEMQSVANVAGGLVSVSDLDREAERQRDRQLDVVSRLEEMAEIGWSNEELEQGSARFAGWDRIPNERDDGDDGDVYDLRRELAERRRRRRVMVVSTEDEEESGGGIGGAGWRAVG
ncbi:hypothetical protein DOTSEDRAFT_57407 [Dothistroma septosporum NZE10]|uniref:Uncharacterized protein n=1 Tax=Dothistroma septosporum (strain NZE10 / CBS 128990) TaxID=675120 RepID=N1PBZ4_DOTSN|nr:hypothetical protein DOTSEDRAFT_57407 [Dothistroma septosporum NZE10]